MIPLSSFLFIYGFFFLLTGVFLFFNVYHIMKYGLDCRATYYVVGFYILFFGFVTIGGFIYILTFDWSSTIELSDFVTEFNPFSGNYALPQ